MGRKDVLQSFKSFDQNFYGDFKWNFLGVFDRDEDEGEGARGDEDAEGGLQSL